MRKNNNNQWVNAEYVNHEEDYVNIMVALKIKMKALQPNHLEKIDLVINLDYMVKYNYAANLNQFANFVNLVEKTIL